MLSLVGSPRYEKKALNKMRNSFRENLFSLFTIQIFAYLLPLLLIPYLIQTIGLARVGEIAVAASVCTLLSLVVEYGFALYGIRRISIARNDNDNHAIAAVYFEVMQSKAILLLLMTPVYFICLFFIFQNVNSIAVYGMSFLIVVGQAFSTVWFFQGLEEMRRPLIYTVLSRTLSLVIIVVFVKSEADYLLVPAIQGAAVVAISMFMLRDAFLRTGRRFIIAPIARTRTVFVEAAPLFATSIMSSAIASGGVVILASFSVANELIGVYSTFERVIRAAQGLFSPITQALFPMSARLLETDKQAARLLLRKTFVTLFALSSGAILAIYVFAEVAVGKIFTQQLAEHSEIVLLFAPWFVAGICNNITGTQYLVASGRSKEYLNFMFFGSIVTLIGQVVLINYFGIAAMAIGMSIGEVLLFVMLTAFYLRDNDVATSRI